MKEDCRGKPFCERIPPRTPFPKTPDCRPNLVASREHPSVGRLRAIPFNGVVPHNSTTKR